MSHDRVTGDTPKEWKRSETVLLHKKGDSADPGNYRPVGLMLTVYKLWTSMITRCPVCSEQNRPLSSSQEGFRQGHNCSCQLANVLNA